MVDVNDDAKGGYRRVEVLTGPGRRRRWTAEDKARIVAETLLPGARVSEVARRWQVCSQQVFGWRREAKSVAEQAADAVNGGAQPAAFVPIVAEPATAAARVAAAPAVIEIKLAGAVVRVVSGTDALLLREVLRAVRCSATPA
jgi:transposase